MIEKILLEGLDCAGCAVKIEEQVGRLEGVESSSLNFVSRTLKVEIVEDADEKPIIESIERIVKGLEPHVNLVYEEEFKKGKEGIQKQSGISSGWDKGWHNIVAGVLILIFVNIAELPKSVEIAAYIAAYTISGYEVLFRAIKDVLAGRLFDENFLMSIATLGALALGEYNEAVAVMLFYQVGEAFQSHAVNNSRRSIRELLNIKPKFANLKKENTIESVNPSDVAIGDIVVVRPGERVPIDGVVESGSSMIDTSALTGESIPQKASKGKKVLSGFINMDSALEVRVEREFEDSAVSKVLELVENASAKKAPTEQFITRFSRYYTPFVVAGALLLAMLPPLLGFGSLAEWVKRSLIFLVVSCPCALVVSVPLGFFGGIGAASKRGILVKGGNYLEAMSKVGSIVFDKTGTITKGNFEVVKVKSFGRFSKEELVEYAAEAEFHSNHPIADSIRRYYAGDIDAQNIISHKNFEGMGVGSMTKNGMVFAGNEKLMAKNGVLFSKGIDEGTIVHVALGAKYVGYILIEDQIKEHAHDAFGEMRSLGVKNLFMLTGDSEKVANKVSRSVGLDGAMAQMLPHEKVSAFEKLQKDFQKGSHGAKTAFVGDGINDAPVLARADIGISMGAMGSDAAIEAADIVIMDDKLSKIPLAIRIASYTRKIVSQNIVLALGIKGLVLILGALGMATMWMAVFADVGVALMAILNSTRVLAKRY